LIAMLVTAAINLSLQRDFAAEWSESLRVKISGRWARTKSNACSVNARAERNKH